MNNKLEQQNQHQEQEEVITPELLVKFDGDKQLVERFLANGYTIQQLEQSQITHPTATDPVVTLKDGKVAGFWL